MTLQVVIPCNLTPEGLALIMELVRQHNDAQIVVAPPVEPAVVEPIQLPVKMEADFPPPRGVIPPHLYRKPRRLR